jgi:Chaperone of endosialidase
MAYTKYSLTPANNTATPPDGAPEGMLPSAVNDTMRDMMAQIRDCGDGIRDGTYTMTAPKITGGTITGVAFTGNTFTSPVISGGSINNTPIGASTANTGAFTTLSATGNTSLDGGSFVFNESGADKDFRIEGDTDVNLFFSDASTDRIGIGISSPASKLEVATGTSGQQSLATFRTANSTAANNAGLQIFATPSATAGSRSVLLSLDADGADTSGGDYFYIQKLGNSGNVELAQYSNADMIFSTNVGAERMRISSSGNVSIGNTTNTYKLDVTGSIRASTYFYASGANVGDGIYLANGSSNGLISQMSNGSASTVTYIGNQTITTSSDIRIKNNVRPTERNALELLGQWEIVDHNWSDPSDQCENNKNSRGVWTGVIAQQIQPITPWLVNKPLEDENKDGSKNLWLVDFAYSVPLLVKAIQEQQAQIEELKQEVALLKAK